MKRTTALLLGAAIAPVFSNIAVAQDDVDTIVVRGIRSSLEASREVKRNASVVVDAVSAEDVGKFPDTNVAEALQRITGVAIDRSGGEGQFITVRGLGPEFNTVLVNGRTIATDNPGREFSFDVLSSDIISRAEVFKTSSSDKQSGGIGSLVNIVTARPFDRPAGPSLTLGVSGTYDTLREETGPEFTGVASWSNSDKSLGILVGASYSDRKVQVDSSFTNGFADRSGNPAIFADEGSSGLQASDIGGLPDGARLQQQVVHSRDIQDRERLTINSAAQAKLSDTLELTIDGLYTEFDIQSTQTQFSGFFSPPFIDPILDENGTVVSFSRPGQDFAMRNPDIAGLVGLSQNDNVLTADNRLAETYQFGVNLEWEVTDRLTVDFDVSTSNATRDATNPFVVIGALAPTSPLIQLPNDDGISTITNLSGLTDASIQRLHFVNVQRLAVEDEVFEARVDGIWDVDRGPLKSIGAGALRTDREKAQDFFDNFSPTQGAAVFCAYCGYNVDAPDEILSVYSFDGFLDGVSGSGDVPGQILNFTFADAFAALNSDAAIMDPNRNSLTGADRAASDADLIARRNAAGDSIFGFYEPAFNPGASFAVEEEITSFYINSEWEGDLDGLPWAANIGFRIAQTDVVSSGFDQPVIEFRESDGDTQLSPVFGATTPVSVENDYINFLPSVNLSIDPTDDTKLRFAYTETVTRPTLTSLGVNNSFGGRSNAPTSTGGNPFLEAFEAQNIDISYEWYFDEVGFFGVAMFHKEFEQFLEVATVAIPREVVFPAGNGGRTADETLVVDFQDTRTRNAESGRISGVEVALQKAFVELPAPFDGLGAAANYTYVTSDIDRDQTSAAADCDYNGLSPHSFNVSGFYEKNGIQARVAYNYRDEFLFQCRSNFEEPREREEFGQLDFSAAYDITDQFQVYVEGINVLGADTRDFSRFQNRFLTYSDTGSRYTVGLRAQF
ncbi:TonB-dependent receptor [Parvularcula sp. ZS-1/3]|uniref:TonB-dependent receptor n=1 Tax=Parvularcula mediterranea TaxID=2732508 RepID=A0A7Y3RLD7_9PROT|nr:TonB-dependent receptor [Parvularcula mediterranea]NNU16218.1 TonB-dependent receptor [Parvularcula mediterranea]